jgi:hypothetical protein
MRVRDMAFVVCLCTNIKQKKKKRMSEVVFLDTQKKTCTIDGVRYMKSWRKPRKVRVKVDRREYMVQYRKKKKSEWMELKAQVESSLEPAVAYEPVSTS